MQVHTEEGKDRFLQGQLKDLQHNMNFSLTHSYNVAIEQYAQMGTGLEIY